MLVCWMDSEGNYFEWKQIQHQKALFLCFILGDILQKKTCFWRKNQMLAAVGNWGKFLLQRRAHESFLDWWNCGEYMNIYIYIYMCSDVYNCTENSQPTEVCLKIRKKQQHKNTQRYDICILINGFCAKTFLWTWI